MVRATRSTQLALEDTPAVTQPTTPTASVKKGGAAKKRKRPSTDNDDTAAEQDSSQLLSPDGESSVHGKPTSGESEKDGDKEDRPNGKRQKTKQVKEEDVAALPVAFPVSPKHKDAGEIPLTTTDADNLLTVLEAVDTENLLDHPFQLPATQVPASSKHAHVSLSLRQILRDPSSYTTRALKSAIIAITPDYPAPRATLSTTYLERKKFSEIASGLLHQITSSHVGAVDTTRTSIDADVDESVKTLVEEEVQSTKYALHQHLPTGDYFTSAASLSMQDAAAMIKGQASLAAVQPAVVIDPSFMPTLGSYSRPLKPTTVPPNRLPPSRKVSSGSILDYGPFASFAPAFDSEGSEITDRELADVLWSKRQQLLARRKGRLELETAPDVEMQEDSKTSEAPAEPAIDPSLGLDDELRDAISQLQLETGIDDLLEKNAWAMQRLVALQNERYRLGEKAPPVQVGSEEWNLAHSLMDSLVALTSLRPRRTGSPSAPLVPPAPVLRALHRTLPVDPTPGWKGTLARERDTAYRDNTTITPGATPYVNPTPAPAPQTSKPTAATPAVPQYPSYSQSYSRPGLPATTSSYYPPHSYYSQYANSPAAAQSAAKPTNQYYYNPYPQYGYTPQYGQTPLYQPTPGTPGQPPRAIPNVTKASAPYVNGWAMGTPAPGQSPAAALPPHLRKTNVAPLPSPSVPGTPTVMGYGAGPVYPPGATASYTPGYPGWQTPKT
ncbi:hypothetical protein FRB99_006075 [Tulasnella sp. 403]|nr:hypothetical protein FRB99_006075 [Tulasnella sp. 403]